MPQVDQYKFTFRELAEMMLERTDVKEGLWGLWVSFGIAASNAGASPDDLKPSAIVPILELGLQKFKEPSNLAVDAAEVRQKGTKGRSKVARPEETPGTSRGLIGRIQSALLELHNEQVTPPEGARLSGAIMLKNKDDMSLFVADREGLLEAGLTDKQADAVMQTAARSLSRAFDAARAKLPNVE